MNSKTTPKITEKEWLEDFNDFMKGDGTAVPEDVSHTVLQYVHNALNPSSWMVFLKLLGIHGVVGTLSLAICDQFGINPFSTGFSLAQYFMKFGHSVCMTICGFLFISLSIFFSRLIFRQEEFVVLKKNVLSQAFSLSAISLGVFMIVGAEFALSIGVLWVIGAVLGGFVTAQIGGLKFSK